MIHETIAFLSMELSLGVDVEHERRAGKQAYRDESPASVRAAVIEHHRRRQCKDRVADELQDLVTRVAGMLMKIAVLLASDVRPDESLVTEDQGERGVYEDIEGAGLADKSGVFQVGVHSEELRSEICNVL